MHDICLTLSNQTVIVISQLTSRISISIFTLICFFFIVIYFLFFYEYVYSLCNTNMCAPYAVAIWKVY